MLFSVSAVPAFAAETTTEITDTQQPVVIGEYDGYLSLIHIYMVKHGEVRCAHRQIVNLLSAGQKFLFFFIQSGKNAGLKMFQSSGCLNFHNAFS